MNSFLLNRQLGSISPQALAQAQNERLLHSLQSASGLKFRHEKQSNISGAAANGAAVSNTGVAHGAGVNSITIDRFEGRYLLSGGADSSVALWDLEDETSTDEHDTVVQPIAHVARTSTTESLGITQVSFYPFDSLAFLSSGYDRTVKLFSSETLTASAVFNIGSTVYAHSTSNVAGHLLVACASQHPAVRLIDLRSGASAHSLAGHSGSVLAVAWHPRDDNVLASGGVDGSCRLWDIRRSTSSLGTLDMEDSVGVVGYDGKGHGARPRERGKAHKGVVNGITWTDDGSYLVSTGHDERMRVWNMITGANTLANFGPALQNAHKAALSPLLAPGHLSRSGSETLFFPNPREILSFDMHSGTLQKRYRVPGLQSSNQPEGGIRNIQNRTTSLAWRSHHVEMYSAHADGSIRCWRPRTWEDIAADREEGVEQDGTGETAERKRKREELDQIVRDLTKRPAVMS